MQTLAHPWLDDSQAPLLFWMLPPEPDDEQLVSFCDGLGAWLKALDQPYAMVIDARKLSSATARQRRVLADMLRDNELELNTWCAGIALVLHSNFARGVVTAVTWVASPGYPMQYFTNIGEGASWARGQLADARQGLTDL